MKILFDASVLNYPHMGVSKTLLYLYMHVHRLYPDYRAYGFGCDKGEYSSYGIELIGDKSDKELLAFARKMDIKIIHYPANYVKRRPVRGLKTVLTLHDLIPLEDWYFSGFLGILLKWRYILRTKYSLYKADQVLTISRYSKSQIENYSRGKVCPEVIYWGVTLPAVQDPGKPDEPYFLYVGGYDQRKGIDKTVEAFLEMRERKLTISKLIITGEVRSLGSEVNGLIEKGVREGWIVQTGDVSETELCQLYSNALCAIYLSLSEGFGLPLIEAMSCHCPIVTTRLTSLPEIGGDAVCYVDRDNRQEIIDVLIKLENDEEYRANIIEKGNRRIKNYQWDNAAEAFYNVLKENQHE